MHDHAQGGAHDAIVKRKLDAMIGNPRRRAGGQRLAYRILRRLAVTRGNFIEVKPQIFARLGQREKEIVERKIV